MDTQLSQAREKTMCKHTKSIFIFKYAHWNGTGQLEKLCTMEDLNKTMGAIYLFYQSDAD